MTGTEYENYGRQYQTFQKIIAVYDTEPDNFPRYGTGLNEQTRHLHIDFMHIV